MLVAIASQLLLCYLNAVENETSMSKDVRVPILITAALFFIFPWEPVKIFILFLFAIEFSLYITKQILDKLAEKYYN